MGYDDNENRFNGLRGLILQQPSWPGKQTDKKKFAHRK